MEVHHKNVLETPFFGGGRFHVSRRDVQGHGGHVISTLQIAAPTCFVPSSSSQWGVSRDEILEDSRLVRVTPFNGSAQKSQWSKF